MSETDKSSSKACKRAHMMSLIAMIVLKKDAAEEIKKGDNMLKYPDRMSFTHFRLKIVVI